MVPRIEVGSRGHLESNAAPALPAILNVVPDQPSMLDLARSSKGILVGLNFPSLRIADCHSPCMTSGGGKSSGVSEQLRIGQVVKLFERLVENRIRWE